MKREPVRKPMTPDYPTLDQLGSPEGKNKAKIAAVTAITATLALASACGDDYSPVRAMKKLAKQRKAVVTTRESYEIMGGEMTEYTEPDVVLEGEETCPIDETILGGEEPVETETTDYYIDGDMQIDPDYTDADVDADIDSAPTEYILEGGVEVNPDSLDG